MKRVLVFCGPSGVGKSTILKRLFEIYPDDYSYSVSHTTRPPRKGEIHGKHYHFVEKEEMEKAIANKDFVETTQYSGNLYGTSKESIINATGEGKICILELDLKGAKSFKENKEFDVVFVFVTPPNHDTLKERLQKRKSETEEQIQNRLEIAMTEIEFVEKNPTFFDYILENTVVDESVNELDSFTSSFFFVKPNE